jgi:polysaccharide biosynthesis protein PslG
VSRARAGLLMLAACIAVVADAGGASAKGPPRAFYGVVPQTKIDDRDLRRMKAGRLGTVRYTLAWSQIDRSPLPDDHDWSEFDAIVAGASRQRITVLPTLYTVPRWLASLEGCDGPGGTCTITPPQSDFGLGEWRSFVAAAVRRYGPEGEFWALNPTIPVRPIRAWQIWNEPNSLDFYQPQPNVNRYAELLVAAAEAIRSEDPGAEVLLGGLWRPLAARAGGIRGTDFLEQLYGWPGIEAAFDGVAIHPYAVRMSGVKAQVRRIGGITRAAGDDDVGVWITELGWASGGPAHPFNRGPSGQARRLEQAFRWFTAKRGRLDIRLVAWYAWRDLDHGELRCEWCARTGLFRAQGLHPKPAWQSLVSLTGGR